MTRRTWMITTALAITVAAGCSSPAISGSDQPGVHAPTVAPGTAGAAQRLTVADSSQPDIAAVLDAAGVSDPENWAKIIKQSGPYPQGPEGQNTLRQVLLRYHASADDTAKITNALVP